MSNVECRVTNRPKPITNDQVMMTARPGTMTNAEWRVTNRSGRMTNDKCRMTNAGRLAAILLLLASAASAAGMLEMTVTGPESRTPGIVTVTGTALAEPVLDGNDLPYLPGWPVKVPYGWYSPSRGITLADFDGDGRLEVIMPSSDSRVHVWKHDGTYYPGWPRTLAGDSCQYAAAVADVDLDGEYEVAVGTRGLTQGGAVYLLDESGNDKPGWPFTGLVGGNFNEAPTLADVDGDDTLEVIIGERDYPIGHLHVIRADGTEQPGAWPCSLDHVPAMGEAVADINLDGRMEIVTASYNSFYVFDPDGAILPGWPRQVAGANVSYQSPALADIDGDDTLEIVTAMHKDAAGTYVFRTDGSIQPGWPRPFPRWSYCSPSVADLYRDSDLKVVCGLAGGMSSLDVLYAMADDASVLAGFPVYMTGGAECNMTVADLDGDGDMEIIYTSNMISSADSLGYLYAVHADGTPVSGWPLRTWGFTYLNGATVADVDGDDSLDIIAVSAYAGQLQVSIWEAGVPFNRMSWEWPTYQFDMQRTGLYRTPTTGIEEKAEGGRMKAEPGLPTIVRGVLGMASSIQYSAARGELLDATGRRVMELAPGANDVSHLRAGVYFVREHPVVSSQYPGAVRKVMLAR